MEQPHVFARILPEFARTEREKCCHLFPLPDSGRVPAALHAYCGFTIAPGEAEWLDAPAGMPCVSCLLMAPLGDGEAPR